MPVPSFEEEKSLKYPKESNFGRSMGTNTDAAPRLFLLSAIADLLLLLRHLLGELDCPSLAKGRPTTSAPRSRAPPPNAVGAVGVGELQLKRRLQRRYLWGDSAAATHQHHNVQQAPCQRGEQDHLAGVAPAPEQAAQRHPKTAGVS